MDLNFDELNTSLTTKLKDNSLEFVVELLKRANGEGLETSSLINLVLSSHMSSLLYCMKALSDGNEEIKNKVNEFIQKTVDFMRNNVPDGKVKSYPH